MTEQGPERRRLAWSRLVGRAEDVRHLERGWDQARTGQGNAVFVSGEAGIGKSRLAAEVEARAHADAALIVRLHGSVLKSNSNLHPVLDHLARHAGIARSEPMAVKAQKIQALLSAGQAGETPPLDKDIVHRLAAMLEPPTPKDVLRSPLRKRVDLLQTLLQTTAHLTAFRPMLILVEDAQWLDPTSRELLERIIRNATAQRLMVIVTARLGFEAEWFELPHVTTLILRRLGRADTLALATQLIAGDTWSPAALAQLVERSEGVPLFIEELSRERPQADNPVLPADLHTLLVSRLDNLGSAKRLAQVAAALGRRFSHDMVAGIVGTSDHEFAQALTALMAADILSPKPIRRGTHYAFRHALIQEAAYASLDAHQRLTLHGEIARVLDGGRLQRMTDQPEIMAHHYDLAGAHLDAAKQWLAAGQMSAASGAVEEAVNDFTRGLASASHALDGDARERLMFELDLNLGPAVMALKGYASAEGLTAFQNARRRLAWSKSSLEETHILLGLFNVHFGRGELMKALEVASQADRFLSVGYGGYPVLTGQTLCMMGQFPDARAILERALAIYDPSVDGQSGMFCRADVVATSFLAKVEFALGNLDTTTLLTSKATELARQQGNPLARAIAYLGQLFLGSERGALAETQALADEALDFVTEHNLGNFKLWISFHRAALLLRNTPDIAIAHMRRIMEEADAAGTLMFRPAQLGLLGAGYASLGKTDEALDALHRGIALARSTSGYEALPALHRFRARVLADRRPEDAIGELEVSLAVARGQSALVEELRSATMLARVSMDADRTGQARMQLARVYQSFTQGHDFPDLKQAARLLASFAR